MVTLYTMPSCKSCRRAKSWLEENHIAYTERNILSEPLNMDEFKRILQMTERGTDDIISTGSKAFQELNIQVDTLSLKQLCKIIRKYPKIIRRPILMDNKNLLVGYNEERIRCFLPRSVRTDELRELLQVMNS